MKSLLFLSFVLFAATCSNAKGGEPMSVMSYNIRYLNERDGDDHWNFRVSAVTETVKQADIVGLQEATKPQIDQIAERAPEYAWYGVGRDDGADRGEFTPIFWRKDQFEVKDKGTFWLGPDPQAVGKPAWGANLPRICSWIVLQDKGSKDSLLVLNTHFDHQSREARANSAKLIRKQAEALSKKFQDSTATVLMGDLNCEVNSEPISTLTSTQQEGTSFTDTWSLTASSPEGPTGTWNGFKEIAEGSRIDFVFVADTKKAIRRHQTLDPKTDKGRFASDHLPILVIIE